MQEEEHKQDVEYDCTPPETPPLPVSSMKCGLSFTIPFSPIRTETIARKLSKHVGTRETVVASDDTSSNPCVGEPDSPQAKRFVDHNDNDDDNGWTFLTTP